MEFDLDDDRNYCPFLFVDDQGRKGVEPIWTAGRNGKRMRGAIPRAARSVLITSIGPRRGVSLEGFGTATGAEMQAWIDDGTAQGLLPWFTKFNGVVPDSRWVAAGGRELSACTRSSSRFSDRCIRQPRSPSSIRRRRCATGTRRSRGRRGHELGFYHALVEARLPFEMLSDRDSATRRSIASS